MSGKHYAYCIPTNAPKEHSSKISQDFKFADIEKVTMYHQYLILLFSSSLLRQRAKKGRFNLVIQT